MNAQIQNCTFFSIKNAIVVTGDVIGDIVLDNILVSTDNQSAWQVKGLGRKDLNTPKGRMGIVLSSTNQKAMPKNGSTLVLQKQMG